MRGRWSEGACLKLVLVCCCAHSHWLPFVLTLPGFALSCALFTCVTTLIAEHISLWRWYLLSFSFLCFAPPPSFLLLPCGLKVYRPVWLMNPIGPFPSPICWDQLPFRDLSFSFHYVELWAKNCNTKREKGGNSKMPVQNNLVINNKLIKDCFMECMGWNQFFNAKQKPHPHVQPSFWSEDSIYK